MTLLPFRLVANFVKPISVYLTIFVELIPLIVAPRIQLILSKLSFNKITVKLVAIKNLFIFDVSMSI